MKKIISLILAMLFCLSLAACGLSAEDVEGEWTCMDDGSGYRIGLAMEDGGFAMSRYDQSDMTGTMTLSGGTYEIDGKEVVLHTRDGETITFEYSNGKLIHENYTLKKK